MTDEERHAHAQRILQTIRDVRNEHSACTAREVARRMKLNAGLLGKQLLNLRTADLVTWTEMAGSLKLTAKGGKFASGK